jgi:hypothetical protein
MRCAGFWVRPQREYVGKSQMSNLEGRQTLEKRTPIHDDIPHSMASFLHCATYMRQDVSHGFGQRRSICLSQGRVTKAGELNRCEQGNALTRTLFCNVFRIGIGKRTSLDLDRANPA